MGFPRGLGDPVISPKPDFNQLLRVLWRDGMPDYVPFYELFVNLEVMEAVLGKRLPDRASTVEFYYRAGYDYAPVWPGLELKVGDLKDTRSGYPIKDWQTFEEYCWPDSSSISFVEFETVAPILPDGMKIIGQTGGIFETAQALCGYVGLCHLLSDDRTLVGAIFERLGPLYEAMYRGMASADQVGAVVISDDMGFKTQTLISPDDLRQFVLPWHKRLAQIVHDNGKPCILHSCGHLSAVMEDIIEDVNIDAKHSYEDSIMPVTEAKKIFGDRVAILGGFDLHRLCTSTEDEIREHVTTLLDSCGTSGGYALGSGNSIAAFVPVENYLSMLDAGWRLTPREESGQGI